jgi:hypothetical protein
VIVGFTGVDSSCGELAKQFVETSPSLALALEVLKTCRDHLELTRWLSHLVRHPMVLSSGAMGLAQHQF